MQSNLVGWTDLFVYASCNFIEHKDNRFNVEGALTDTRS